MLNQQTIDKLKEMKLLGLLGAWTEQQAQPDFAGLGFDERLGLLVDAEWLGRMNAKLKRNLKEARLKLGSACLEDLDYDERREIDEPREHLAVSSRRRHGRELRGEEAQGPRVERVSEQRRELRRVASRRAAEARAETPGHG